MLALAVSSLALLQGGDYLPPPTPAVEEREARPWPHEINGLPPDPRVRLDALENGIRIVTSPGDGHGEGIALWMHVAVGSLVEEDEERGMAHVLEHLLFRGTEYFEGRALLDWSQAHGMEFGADLNGWTGPYDTRFFLNLPSGDRELVQTALKVLAEFVSSPLLEPEALGSELRVVDAEEREGVTPRSRFERASIRWMYGGTRLAERPPIGERSARAKFDAGALRLFHDRWYTPDRITLVLVGDVPDDVGVLVSEAFGGIRPRAGSEVGEPPVGVPRWPRRELVHVDDALDGAVLQVSAMRPVASRPFTRDRIAAAVPLEVARIALARRLARLAEERRDVLDELEVQTLDARGRRPVEAVFVGLRCPTGSWRQALQLLRREVEAALAEGFSADEVETALETFLARVEQDLRLQGDLHDIDEAHDVVRALGRSFGLHDPRAYADIVREAAAEVGPESCREALASAWGSEPPLLSYGGPIGGPADGAELRSAYDAFDDSEPVTPIAVDGHFAYSARPSRPAAVVSRVHEVAWNLSTVLLDNGVRLFVVPNGGERVSVRAILHSGTDDLSPRKRWMGRLADQTLLGMGLGKHTEVEWQSMLEAMDLSLTFQTGRRVLWFDGTCDGRDLGVQCELIAAHLRDPGWREEAVDAFVSGVRERWSSYLEVPEIAVLLCLSPHLERAGVAGFPALEQLDELEFRDLREWLAPAFASAPLDVILWGGGDVDDLVAVAARTFGVLPDRRLPGERLPPTDLELPEGVRLACDCGSSLERGRVQLLVPIDGVRGDEPEAWNLNLLRDVLADRVRRRVRDDLGLSYAPGVLVWGSGSTVGYYEAIQVDAAGPPGRLEALLDSCLEELRLLSVDGVDEEELTRMRAPLAADHREASLLDLLTDLAQDPDALAKWRAEGVHYGSVSAAEVSYTASRYLDPSRASWAVVRPRAEVRGE